MVFPRKGKRNLIRFDGAFPDGISVNLKPSVFVRAIVADIHDVHLVLSVLMALNSCRSLAGLLHFKTWMLVRVGGDLQKIGFVCARGYWWLELVKEKP